MNRKQSWSVFASVMLAVFTGMIPGYSMERQIRPLTDLRDFDQVESQLGLISFYARVKSSPTQDVENKGVTYGFTARLRWRLRHEIVPDEDFVASHLVLNEGYELTSNLDTNSDGILDKHTTKVDLAYLPVRLKSREVILCQTSNNLNATLFYPSDGQPFDEARAKRLYIQSMGEIFPWIPNEADLEAVRKDDAYEIGFKQGVRIGSVWGTALARVSKNYVMITMGLYGRGDSRPARVVQSHEWFAFLNRHYKGSYSIQPLANTTDLDVASTELPPALKAYVTPQSKETSTVVASDYKGVVEAFSWRLKKFFQPQYVPGGNFLSQNIVLQRSRKVNAGTNADIASFSARFEGSDKRDFIISQTSDRIVVTGVNSWGNNEVKNEEDARQVLSKFMKAWMLRAPAPEDFNSTKAGGRYNLVLKDKKDLGDGFKNFQAIVTDHTIAIIVNAPQFRKTFAPVVAADKWFDIEK